MAIKNKLSRDTYRSNVKIRPLRQNGLEAQYQGLDVKEVNIDHAGLWMLGRGSNLKSRRNVIKVRSQYIVDMSEIDSFASATFEINPTFGNSSTTLKTLYADTNTTISITDDSGTTKTFQFHAVSTSGTILSSGNIAVFVPDTGRNAQSLRAHMTELKKAIDTVFGDNIFTVEQGPFYARSLEPRTDTPSETIMRGNASSIRITTAIANFLGPLNVQSPAVTFIDDFSDLNEKHRWFFDGHVQNKEIRHAFYEDLRTDLFQSVENNILGRKLHKPSQVSDGSILPQGQVIIRLEEKLNNVAAPISYQLNPRNNDLKTTIVSDFIELKQVPLREEVFQSYEDNLQFREDVHYIDPNEQVWTQMNRMAPLYVNTGTMTYGSVLEQHIANLMDNPYVDEQYIQKDVMSSRVDVFKRLSRIFDLNVDLVYERHPYAVFDQYLDNIPDYINVNENRVPYRDRTNNDIPFEDNRGKRNEQEMIFDDTFSQEPLDAHDYIEHDRYTRIDNDMLVYLTAIDHDHDDDVSTGNVLTGRSYAIDRREWQQSDYIYTSTGYINSQVTGIDGIMYRDLKR